MYSICSDEDAVTVFLRAFAALCEACVRRRALVVCAFFAALALHIPPAFAEEDTAPATAGMEEEKKRSFSTGTDFFDDAGVSGGIYYFQRDRRRYNPETGDYHVNLNHATAQANAEFVSGFAGGVVGVDFGVFGSADLKNSGAVDHEMNFLPWGDPWHPDWSNTETKDGFSIYKAHLKAKGGPVWGKAGYFQPSGPGVLGVNWSIMPGTYEGVEAGADFGRLSVAASWADAYKAPWFKSVNHFLQTDGKTHVAWMWSAGARYSFDAGLTFEMAYGESEDYLKNAHFKSRYATQLGEGTLTAGYHLYLMDDSDDSVDSPNDNFAGIASQHYLFTRYTTGPWTLRLEGTYTRAPFRGKEQQGYFAYRLTTPNGSSKGAYECWWDARSDWNAHNEKAGYFQVERSLDDLVPVKGFSAASGAVMGWDGEGYGAAEHLKEWAFTFDLGYTRPEGPLQGAFIKLHYTEYRNGTHKGDWTPYKNGFQSERDFKLFAGIPFNI